MRFVKPRRYQLLSVSNIKRCTCAARARARTLRAYRLTYVTCRKREKEKRRENNQPEKRNRLEALKFLRSLDYRCETVSGRKKISRSNAKEVELAEWAKLCVEEFEDKFCALCSN